MSTEYITPQNQTPARETEHNPLQIRPIDLVRFGATNHGNEEKFCSERLSVNPRCAVCLQIQERLARWGLKEEVTRSALRHALCGRWHLLDSLHRERSLMRFP